MIMRKAVKPDLKLAVTLEYLATGAPFKVLGQSFALGTSSVRLYIEGELYRV